MIAHITRRETHRLIKMLTFRTNPKKILLRKFASVLESAMKFTGRKKSISPRKKKKSFNRHFFYKFPPTILSASRSLNTKYFLMRLTFTMPLQFHVYYIGLLIPDGKQMTYLIFLAAGAV